MSYSFPAQKFASARGLLRAATCGAEHEALAQAFLECRLGLHRMNRATMDQKVRMRIYALECFMSSEGFSDANGESAWTLKLKSLNAAQRQEILALIEELTEWFERQAP